MGWNFSRSLQLVRKPSRLPTYNIPPRQSAYNNSKIGTGILMLFTFGGFGIWALIDFIMVILGNFTDSDGLKISNR